MKIIWDKWQKEFLEHQGSCSIRSGRQVGKSVAAAAKIAAFVTLHKGVNLLVIAASQRQSGLLFEKVTSNLVHGGVLGDKPTLGKLGLKNGSNVYCMPAGRTGFFIMGFTFDVIAVDEAAFVPMPVFNSILPMLAVSHKLRGFGWLWQFSMPFMKGGHFYESFSDPAVKTWHISSEDCPRISKEFLLKEKKRLSKEEYARIYCGEFTDEYRQFFKSDLLSSQTTLMEWELKDRWANSRFYMGVDVARYGGDQNAFVITEMLGNRLRVVSCETTEMVSTVDTIGRVVALNKLYNFKRVFVDDAGVGGAVTDVLIDKLGRKVVGLNNANKGIPIKDEENDDVEMRLKILKEDLYSNALFLLESGQLDLIHDLDLLHSLKSITFNYTVNGTVKIYGKDSHLAEAMVRAVWCVRDKGLEIYLY